MTLTKDEAKRLTERIELRLSAIADNTEAVVTLIVEAREGHAEAALGFDTWNDYVHASFGHQLERLHRADRQPVSALLAEAGMSTRAIAELVGAGHATVARDLQASQSETPDQPELPGLPEKVTGRDGKTYPRSRPTAQQAQDIGSAVPPITRRPVPTYAEDYQKQIVELFRVIGRLTVLHKDDQFTREATPLEATRLRVASRMLADAADQHEQACRG